MTGLLSFLFSTHLLSSLNDLLGVFSLGGWKRGWRQKAALSRYTAQGSSGSSVPAATFPISHIQQNLFQVLLGKHKEPLQPLHNPGRSQQNSSPVTSPYSPACPKSFPGGCCQSAPSLLALGVMCRTAALSDNDGKLLHRRQRIGEVISELQADACPGSMTSSNILSYLLKLTFCKNTGLAGWLLISNRSLPLSG